jgi:hypothetical protein
MRRRRGLLSTPEPFERLLTQGASTRRCGAPARTTTQYAPGAGLVLGETYKERESGRYVTPDDVVVDGARLSKECVRVSLSDLGPARQTASSSARPAASRWASLAAAAVRTRS